MLPRRMRGSSPRALQARAWVNEIGYAENCSASAMSFAAAFSVRFTAHFLRRWLIHDFAEYHPRRARQLSLHGTGCRKVTVEPEGLRHGEVSIGAGPVTCFVVINLRE